MILLTRSNSGPVTRTHEDVLLVVTSLNNATLKKLVKVFSFGDDTWKVLRFIRGALSQLTRDRMIFRDDGRYYSTPEGIDRAGKYLAPLPQHTLEMLLRRQIA